MGTFLVKTSTTHGVRRIFFDYIILYSKKVGHMEHFKELKNNDTDIWMGIHKMAQYGSQDGQG
jgi:hypothetical protein